MFNIGTILQLKQESTVNYFLLLHYSLCRFHYRKKEEEQPLLEDEKVVAKQAVPTSANEVTPNYEGL